MPSNTQKMSYSTCISSLQSQKEKKMLAFRNRAVLTGVENPEKKTEEGRSQ